VEYLLECGQQFDDSVHRRLVRFVQSAMNSGDWQAALQEHYGIQNLGELQLSWVEWVGSDAKVLPTVAEVSPVIAERTNVPVALTSAKPLPPPSGKSIYDRREKTISTPGISTRGISRQGNDEKPLAIPTSFGRNVIFR
jgi:hypothetical protein